MILRLASYLKIADFGRRCAISQPLLDMRPARSAGLSGGSSLGQRPATLFISFFCIAGPLAHPDRFTLLQLISTNQLAGACSAVSKQNFASNNAFGSIFQDVHIFALLQTQYFSK